MVKVDINPLRNLLFVRNFGNSIIDETGTRQRMRNGRLEPTAIDPTVQPKDISKAAEEKKIEIQKTKTPQDRIIDIYS